MFDRGVITPLLPLSIILIEVEFFVKSMELFMSELDWFLFFMLLWTAARLRRGLHLRVNPLNMKSSLDC